MEKNRFGSGKLYNEEDIKGQIYSTCCACMSIYSEFLSWANNNIERFESNAEFAENIIVLSCQVTDLAVLNDFRHLERLMKEWPKKQFYIGGCLARRFDIPLPDGVKRLGNIKSDYTEIKDYWMTNYEIPFWVKNFDDNGNKLSDGHLFRKNYPLRIGSGCNGSCKYCTIRDTRGKAYELKPSIIEFLNNDNIVLIADSPKVGQLLEWCDIATEFKKPISIRNVEPHITMLISDRLKRLADDGLLEVYHSPIQSPDPFVLSDMDRNIKATMKYISFVKELRSRGVFVATNIIIDYKDFLNPNMDKLLEIFDYVSWNPLWNGIWNRSKAEQRFEKYLS